MGFLVSPTRITAPLNRPENTNQMSCVDEDEQRKPAQRRGPCWLGLSQMSNTVGGGGGMVMPTPLAERNTAL